MLHQWPLLRACYCLTNGSQISGPWPLAFGFHLWPWPLWPLASFGRWRLGSAGLWCLAPSLWPLASDLWPLFDRRLLLAASGLWPLTAGRWLAWPVTFWFWPWAFGFWPHIGRQCLHSWPQIGLPIASQVAPEPSLVLERWPQMGESTFRQWPPLREANASQLAHPQISGPWPLTFGFSPLALASFLWPPAFRRRWRLGSFGLRPLPLAAL